LRKPAPGPGRTLALGGGASRRGKPCRAPSATGSWDGRAVGVRLPGEPRGRTALAPKPIRAGQVVGARALAGGPATRETCRSCRPRRRKVAEMNAPQTASKRRECKVVGGCQTGVQDGLGQQRSAWSVQRAQGLAHPSRRRLASRRRACWPDRRSSPPGPVPGRRRGSTRLTRPLRQQGRPVQRSLGSGAIEVQRRGGGEFRRAEAEPRGGPSASPGSSTTLRGGGSIGGLG